MSGIKLVGLKGAPKHPDAIEDPSLGSMYGVSSSVLPELKDWEVGGKYVLVIEVEQVATKKPDEWQIKEGMVGQDDLLGDFRILRAAAVPSEGTDED